MTNSNLVARILVDRETGQLRMDHLKFGGQEIALTLEWREELQAFVSIAIMGVGPVQEDDTEEGAVVGQLRMNVDERSI